MTTTVKNASSQENSKETIFKTSSQTHCVFANFWWLYILVGAKVIKCTHAGESRELKRK